MLVSTRIRSPSTPSELELELTDPSLKHEVIETLSEQSEDCDPRLLNFLSDASRYIAERDGAQEASIHADGLVRGVGGLSMNGVFAEANESTVRWG